MSLSLREFHCERNASFQTVSNSEVVGHYGDVLAEHGALCESAGVLDLSWRGRLCLTGGDRQRFLNGQVSNNVAALKTGEGCYAALINAKGKMLADLNIYLLENEILLDFEPGLSAAVAERLDKYIIADDVQVVDVEPHYGLISVQGPRTDAVLETLEIGQALPGILRTFATWKDAAGGDLYLMNQPRTGTAGYDLFAPVGAMEALLEKLIAAAQRVGGRACGFQALEMARIEAGIPRFGVDMDATNLPPEAGLDKTAISYTKGCYIGQEIIARLRTYGQVAKALRGLKLSDELGALPLRGDKLLKDGKEVGYITSALQSPALGANIALGYVRREANKPGTELTLRTAEGESRARIVELPFRKEGLSG
jgi:folate-binding protein YgfZ